MSVAGRRCSIAVETRQRLGSLLLRRHLVYRDGSTWTLKHRRWLRSLSFDDSGTQATFAHLLASVEEPELRVAAIDADLAGFFERELFVDEVARLAAYRGIDQLSTLTMASEVCDWRRFPAPTKFMGFVGLVPSEYSTGASMHRSGSPKPATRTSATHWSKPRGPTGIRRGSALSSSAATKDSLPTSWLVPGLPRSGCADGSNDARHAKTAAPLSPPQLPANSPGSCGPR